MSKFIFKMRRMINLKGLVLFFAATYFVSMNIVFANAFWGKLEKLYRDHLLIYHDYGYLDNVGSPSGWGGDIDSIKINLNHIDEPFSGDSCIEINYTADDRAKQKWAIIFWQNAPQLYDISSMNKLIFYAKGKRGGEIIELVVGLKDDSGQVKEKIELTPEWEKYSIDLGKENLTNISGLFGCIITLRNNPYGVIFYLDEINLGG